MSLADPSERSWGSSALGFAASSFQARLACLIVGGTILLGLVSFIAFATGTYVPRFDPLGMNIMVRLEGPSATHWMGTDKIGRDILARVVAGAWMSLSVAFLVLFVAATLGTIVGLIAGYVGGWIDEALMRFTDLFLVFPALILAAAIAASIGGGLIPTAISLASVFWPWYARLVRSRVLTVKEMEFVTASRSMGATHRRSIRRALLPMAWPLVIVQATSDMGVVLLAASGLSFLGLGAQPPAPEWGAMIFDGLSHQPTAWWMVVFPGGAIAIVAMGFNLLGDALRDYVDPALTAGEPI